MYHAPRPRAGTDKMTILGRLDRGRDAARTSHQRGGWAVRRPADTHPLITRPTVGHAIAHCTNPFNACSFCVCTNHGLNV